MGAGLRAGTSSNMINDINRMDRQGRRSPLISCIRALDKRQNVRICGNRSKIARREIARSGTFFSVKSLQKHCFFVYIDLS
ncbi:hypothetical protein Desti_5620 [Desulfomonile tiedjei DSM 6799]|uniref:Uncharacterized protein n=1 Tax=Desulfomonile tiedjei (strain ATCC 49306 / DSM 6799 / DCB-1) TaxID=706587 RepID=I4CF59_DESTA|nr:hypothetical protein Desti_5620 [Desulfomonile tiedjei DSM 6799]